MSQETCEVADEYGWFHGKTIFTVRAESFIF